MLVAWDMCCQILSITNPLTFALSLTYGVGGYWCPIHVSAIHMAEPCWKLTTRATNYASIFLAMTFIIVVHPTWIMLFIGCCCSGVLLVSDDSLLR